MQRNKFNNKLVVLLVLLLILIATEEKGASVPVIPNESLVTGTVSEYAIVSSQVIGILPEQAICRLIITINATESVDGKPNLLADKNGQDIPFYSREKLAPEVAGKRIKAWVTFRGDEQGGLYWIRNIEIIK